MEQASNELLGNGCLFVALRTVILNKNFTSFSFYKWVFWCGGQWYQSLKIFLNHCMSSSHDKTSFIHIALDRNINTREL